MEPERVLTVYFYRLDESTCRLLSGVLISLPALAYTAHVSGRGLAYAVPWARDNQYVHKAVRRKLREAIKAAKASALDPKSKQR